ncbi:uncharacterized protein LOC144173451 isoform X1 [Haemaphysalis longicornis]
MHSTVHFLFFIVAFLTNFAKSQQSVAKTDETDPRCALSLKRQDLFKECLNKSYPVVDKVLNDTLGWEHFTDTARKICDPLSVLEPQIQPEVLAPSTAEPQDQANAVTPPPVTPEMLDKLAKLIEECTRKIMQPGIPAILSS